MVRGITRLITINTDKGYSVVLSYGRFVTAIFVGRTDRWMMEKRGCSRGLWWACGYTERPPQSQTHVHFESYLSIKLHIVYGL